MKSVGNEKSYRKIRHEFKDPFLVCVHIPSDYDEYTDSYHEETFGKEHWHSDLDGLYKALILSKPNIRDALKTPTSSFAFNVSMIQYDRPKEIRAKHASTQEVSSKVEL